MRRIGILLAVLLAIHWPTATPATPRGEEMCIAAGRAAAAATGVPESVLRAISLTETGRMQEGRLRAWPWTVNMEGKGKWFDDRASALAYVNAHHARGARSYDVGCFQINYRWHGNAFASVEDMFDPQKNALYAAQFLSDLYRETGSWAKSAGAYHSRTPKYANRYRKRFERILARVTGGKLPPETPPTATARVTARVEVPLADPPPAPVPEVPEILPVAVAGPLTISPPAAGRNGSLMPLDTLPGGTPLLTQPPRPLF